MIESQPFIQTISKVWVVVLAASGGLFSAGADARDALTVQHSRDGSVVARHTSGATLWEVSRFLGRGIERVGQDALGRIILDDRFAVDRFGHLTGLGYRDDGASSAAALQQSNFTYGTPVPISGGLPQNEYLATPPVFDSNGDAWVVMRGNDNQVNGAPDVIQVVKSEGRDGVWGVPTTLYTGGDAVFVPRVVIDSNDNITVVFRELVATGNYIRALRYTPGSGWSGPQVAYTTQDFFQQVDAAVDASGNVVVSFDPEGGSMSSVVYDVVTGTWSDAIPVSPTTAGNVEFATLIQNRTATHIYGVYWETSGPGKSLYIRRFISPQVGWAPVRRVPGTRGTGIPGGTGPQSFIPATVDDSGAVTLVSYLEIPIAPSDSFWIVLGARLEDGAWSVQLVTVHEDYSPLLSDFGDADYSNDGDVVIVFPRSAKPERTAYISSFNYTSSTNTWVPHRIKDIGGTERKADALYLSDGTALAVFTSIATWVYQNGQWNPDEIAVSGPGGTGQEISASGLDALLVYTSDDRPQSIFASWLKDASSRPIGAVELKGVLGNINAQHAYSHVDLPSKFKGLRQKDKSEGPRRTSGVGGDGSLH